MWLESFTDSLCSKAPPPSLDILWCKELFFKTWISVVFSTVFLKKKKTMNFWFFSHSWSLKCRIFFRMAHKPTNKFLDSLASNSYLPYIIQPGRHTSHSRTFIDNIFSNVISKDLKSNFLAILQLQFQTTHHNF